MKKGLRFDLQLFGSTMYDSNFFKEAFENSIDNTDDSSYNESENEESIDETIVEEEDAPEVTETHQEESTEANQETHVPPVTEGPSLTQAEVESMMKEFMEKNQPKQSAPEIPEEYKQAMQLMTYLQSNPGVVDVMRQADPNAQTVASTVAPTPLEKEVQTLKSKLEEIEEANANDFYTSQVNSLKEKYADYDEDKVLDFAYESGLTGENNLENAYFVLKARGELGEVKQDAPEVKTQVSDTEALRAEIEAKVRAEVEAELIKKNAEATGTTIGGKDATPQVSEITLTDAEAKMAKAFNMTPEEWKKYSV